MPFVPLTLWNMLFLTAWNLNAVCVSDPPLLQTNGKMPMWFRRLVSGDSLITELCVYQPVLMRSCVCVCVQQSQDNASAVVQSEAEPRQVRSRWAEQTDPVIICSSSSPEKEEDEDFHPQSLEELLDEEEEDEEEGEKQAGLGGEDRSYVLYTATDDTNACSDR